VQAEGHIPIYGVRLIVISESECLHKVLDSEIQSNSDRGERNIKGTELKNGKAANVSVTGLNLDTPSSASNVIKEWEGRLDEEEYVESGVDDDVSSYLRPIDQEGQKRR